MQVISHKICDQKADWTVFTGSGRAAQLRWTRILLELLPPVSDNETAPRCVCSLKTEFRVTSGECRESLAGEGSHRSKTERRFTKPHLFCNCRVYSSTANHGCLRGWQVQYQEVLSQKLGLLENVPKPQERGHCIPAAHSRSSAAQSVSLGIGNRYGLIFSSVRRPMPCTRVTSSTL